AAAPFAALDLTVVVAVHIGEAHLRVVDAGRGRRGRVAAVAAERHTAGAGNAPVAEGARVLRRIDDCFDDRRAPLAVRDISHRAEAARVRLPAENVPIHGADRVLVVPIEETLHVLGRLRDLTDDLAYGRTTVQPVDPTLAAGVGRPLEHVPVQLVNDVACIGRARLLRHGEAGRHR